MSEYQELAFKYFRGEISPEEEGVLYRWVNESEQNLAALHAWEDDWKQSSSARDSEPWTHILGRLAARGALEEGEIRIRKRNPRLLWYAAAAAVAVLAVLPFIPRHQDEVQLYTMEAPAGEKCRVVLPDSSVVWLNSGSRLCFDDSFNKHGRSVRLFGEGYFDVTHNEGRPFSVSCDEVSITVHGTKFNVCAYPEERYVKASVLDGHVSLCHDQAKVELLKGQSARYDVVSGVFVRSDELPEDAAAWTESRFVYDNITLGELAERLSRIYAVRFHFNTTEHLNDRFSISLRNNETLPVVLEALERIIPVRARIDADNVYIEKK